MIVNHEYNTVYDNIWNKSMRIFKFICSFVLKYLKLKKNTVLHVQQTN